MIRFLVFIVCSIAVCECKCLQSDFFPFPIYSLTLSPCWEKSGVSCRRTSFRLRLHFISFTVGVIGSLQLLKKNKKKQSFCDKKQCKINTVLLSVNRFKWMHLVTFYGLTQCCNALLLKVTFPNNWNWHRFVRHLHKDLHLRVITMSRRCCFLFFKYQTMACTEGWRCEESAIKMYFNFIILSFTYNRFSNLAKFKTRIC